MDMYVWLFLLLVTAVFATVLLINEVKRDIDMERKIKEIEEMDLANYYGMSLREFREWKEN